MCLVSKPHILTMKRIFDLLPITDHCRHEQLAMLQTAWERVGAFCCTLTGLWIARMVRQEKWLLIDVTRSQVTISTME
jgi:hypothetical protein